MAYLDASVTLGAAALTTVASRLGIGVTRLRPRHAIIALRTAASRYDGMLGMRRATVVSYVSRRFADLSTQGHGPQRHEGVVTRAMLEARVLRGIDPMTGTRIDGETGRPHVAVSSVPVYDTRSLRRRRKLRPSQPRISPRATLRCLIWTIVTAISRLHCQSKMFWGATCWPPSKGLSALVRAVTRKESPR